MTAISGSPPMHSRARAASIAFRWSCRGIEVLLASSIAAAASLVSPTTAMVSSPPASPSIEIKASTIRPDSSGQYVCVGLCPSYRLTIDMKRNVVAVDGLGREYRYRASRAQFARFQKWLSVRIPENSERSIDQICGVAPLLQVRWIPESHARPAFCVAYPLPDDGIFKAIDALGVNDLDGRPFADLKGVRTAHFIRKH